MWPYCRLGYGVQNDKSVKKFLDIKEEDYFSQDLPHITPIETKGRKYQKFKNILNGKKKKKGDILFDFDLCQMKETNSESGAYKIKLGRLSGAFLTQP